MTTDWIRDFFFSALLTAACLFSPLAFQQVMPAKKADLVLRPITHTRVFVPSVAPDVPTSAPENRQVSEIIPSAPPPQVPLPPLSLSSVPASVPVLPPVALDPVRIEFDRLPSSTSPLLEPVSPGVLGLDAVDSSPQSVAQAEPVYPFQASLRRIEGFVVVEFIVTSEGRTRELQVVESSPPAVFEAAALQAVKQWTFDPAVKNGRAVDVRVRQRVAFRLDP